MTRTAYIILGSIVVVIIGAVVNLADWRYEADYTGFMILALILAIGFAAREQRRSAREKLPCQVCGKLTAGQMDGRAVCPDCAERLQTTSPNRSDGHERARTSPPARRAQAADMQKSRAYRLGRFWARKRSRYIVISAAACVVGIAVLIGVNLGEHEAVSGGSPSVSPIVGRASASDPQGDIETASTQFRDEDWLYFRPVMDIKQVEIRADGSFLSVSLAFFDPVPTGPRPGDSFYGPDYSVFLSLFGFPGHETDEDCLDLSVAMGDPEQEGWVTTYTGDSGRTVTLRARPIMTGNTIQLGVPLADIPELRSPFRVHVFCLWIGPVTPQSPTPSFSDGLRLDFPMTEEEIAKLTQNSTSSSQVVSATITAQTTSTSSNKQPGDSQSLNTTSVSGTASPASTSSLSTTATTKRMEDLGIDLSRGPWSASQFPGLDENPLAITYQTGAEPSGKPADGDTGLVPQGTSVAGAVERFTHALVTGDIDSASACVTADFFKNTYSTFFAPGTLELDLFSPGWYVVYGAKVKVFGYLHYANGTKSAVLFTGACDVVGDPVLYQCQIWRPR